VRRHDTGKQQQLANGQHGDDQLECGRLTDPPNIQPREHQEGNQGNALVYPIGIRGIDAGKPIEHVGTNGHRDCRRSEYELQHLGQPADVTSDEPQPPHAVYKDAACARDGAGHFRVTEYKRDIHQCDDSECRQHAVGAAHGQSEIPPEILA